MKTINPKLAAFYFFYKHAGFSYDPKIETPKQGKANCARALAKAERDARALGYTFEWLYDEDGCSGCSCDSPECKCSSGESHECFWCACYDYEGTIRSSLSGICEPSREYRRVIEAELASEALAERKGE